LLNTYPIATKPPPKYSSHHAASDGTIFSIAACEPFPQTSPFQFFFCKLQSRPIFFFSKTKNHKKTPYLAQFSPNLDEITTKILVPSRCIRLYRLYRFYPVDQLSKVVRACGHPTPRDIASMKSPFAATMLDSLPPGRAVGVAAMFPGGGKDALDLMGRCVAVAGSGWVAVAVWQDAEMGYPLVFE
jgi:hypothetical protein